MKVVQLLSLFFVSYAYARVTWKFKFAKKQMAPAVGRISTLNDMTMEKCAVKCTDTEHCQSVSYNGQTKQCILQATLSTDKYLRPVDDADFIFGDMIPALPENERMNISLCTFLTPCVNGGSCQDISGPEYECKCYTGFQGTNCSEELSVKIVMITGYSNIGIEIYDIKHPENSTTLHSALDPSRRHFYSVQLSDSRVLLVGGYNAQPTYFYNPQNNTFTSAGLPTMNVQGNAAALFNGVPIFCGGAPNGGGAALATCSKFLFDNSSQNWVFESMKSMQIPRVNLVMIVYGNKIYAIGGTAISSAERYDPVNDTWEYIAPMNTGRSYVAAAVLNDKIYVCGGIAQRSCERYDPNQNTWTNVASTTFTRRGPRMVEVYGKLYIFGGETGYIKVEEYNPDTNQWTTKSDLKAGHSYGGIAVIV